MIPVAKPYLTKEILSFAHEALDEGFLSNNKYNKMVEEMLPEFTGCKYNLLVSSGTAANMLMAYVAHNVFGNRILKVPNNCYIAAYNPFIEYFKLKVIDTDPYTWNLNPNLIGDYGLLLVVHNLGNPVDFDKIEEKGKFIILEDNCEGFTGKYNQVPTGSIGNMSSISFFGNKIAAAGEGGCFSTNEENFYMLAKSRSEQGVSDRRYIHNSIGFNFRMTNIQAALIYGQLKFINEIKERRQQVFDNYKKLLKDYVTFQYIEKNCTHSNWMCGIRITGNKKYDLVDDYFSKKGIETRPLFYPISYHIPYAEYETTSMAMHLSDEVVLLPTFPELRYEDQVYISETVKEYIKEKV